MGSVEDTADNVRCVARGVVRVSYAKADSDCDRGGQAVNRAQHPRHPSQPLWKADRRKTSSNAQSLECLVEYDHRVQRCKFVASSSKSESNDHAVEDDSKLQDEECRD